MDRKQFPISHVLKSVADFFMANPKAFTNTYIALRNGQRTSYNSPYADQWDITGRIGKVLWDDYNFRMELGNLWVFKRMARAFKEANQVDCQELESPFLVFELHCADNVYDVITALNKAAEYAKSHGLDEPLDLTPVKQPDEAPPTRLYI